MKLLKIYSQSCGPCKVLENNLQLSGLTYQSVDVQSDEGSEITEKYGVRTVPTLLLLNDNNEVIKKHVGVMSVNELRDFYNE